MPSPPKRLIWAAVALFVLLGTTLGFAYVPLGKMNIAVALAIATAKALVVALVFMELARGPSLRWVFAGAGLFWLMFLFGLSMTDYAARRGWPGGG